MNIAKRVLVGIVGVSACVLSACSLEDVVDVAESLQGATETQTSTTQGVDADVLEFSGNTDTFYRSVGKAQVEHKDAREDVITYNGLDALGRATGAYGFITKDMYENAKGSNPSITVDPSGWQKNQRVQIAAGGKSYSGWFYNRSHLVADSLGGNVSAENLITGTRMQNVGWNDRKGGMAYLEEKTRQFLEKNNDCPVYYAATPNYKGNELVARTVTVDAQSCNKVIDERVIVDNVAPGFTINYATGEFKKN